MGGEHFLVRPAGGWRAIVERGGATRRLENIAASEGDDVGACK